MNGLHEIVDVRAEVGQGVYLCITRKCPLECAHCYTDSSPTAEGELDAGDVIRFVRSFAEPGRPKWLLLSGGEPFLRPHLISEVAELCSSYGTKTYVNTGLFFAISRRIPKYIDRAISRIDHLSISLDIYHDQFVPFMNVVRFIEWHLKRYPNKGISIQLCETRSDDGYLERATSFLAAAFGQKVTVGIMKLQPMGRGKNLDPAAMGRTVVQGCPSVGWPQITFDGTILACCTSHHLTRKPPPHLVLGNIADTEWKAVRTRLESRLSLRLINRLGPKWIADRFDEFNSSEKSTICGKCMTLPSNLDDAINSDAFLNDIVVPFLFGGDDAKRPSIEPVFKMVT